MQELEILGMEVGTVAVQPWAGLGEQTTGQKALVSNWSHSSPLAPSSILLSLSYTVIQGRTLRPFIPMDQPQAGGKDTMSANGLRIPNHSALTRNSRLPFLKGLSYTAKASKDIALDLQSSPCMLRLFSYQLREGA